MNKSCKTGCLRKSSSAPLGLAESASSTVAQETSAQRHMLVPSLRQPDHTSDSPVVCLRLCSGCSEILGRDQNLGLRKEVYPFFYEDRLVLNWGVFDPF